MKAPNCLKLLIPSFLLFLSSLSAQTATTDPVGYTALNISSGYTSIGINFCKPPVFTGEVLDSSVDTLLLNSTLSLGLEKYYIEVLSSAEDIVGERIDIIDANGAQLNLNMTAPHNTLSDASVIVPGSVITIRPHFLISDFDLALGDNVNTDNAFRLSTSDQIILFDGSFKKHLNYQGTWYKGFGDSGVATESILPPGSGLFYYRNPNAGTPSDFAATLLGVVRMNNFVLKLTPGYQFVSSGYPVETSPDDLGYNYLEGSTNFDPDESDLLLTWNGNFEPHFLFDDGNGSKQWYQNFGMSEIVNELDIFSATDSHFIFIREAGQVIEVSRPF